ncbi:MAG: hypothetical protein RR193_03315 [Christensenellaceae bacterium]
MKKVLCICTLLLVVCIAFVACEPPAFRGIESYLYEIIAVNTPFVESDGKIDELETDAYGRALYSYTTNHFIVYFICQKHDADSTYYYEDFGVLVKRSQDSISQKEIDILKSINDWDEPLDQTKMSSRKMKPSRSANEYYWLEVGEIIERKFISDDNYEYETVPVQFDSNGKSLYYVNVYDKRDRVESKKHFFMILNADGSYNDNKYLIEVSDIYNFQNQLHEFKIQNGWKFS